MTLEHILLSLLVSLLLTAILELVFALVFRVRGYTLLIVTLVNILTNPAVVVLFNLFCRHYSLPELAVIPILEISAVLIEALIYKTRCSTIKRPFLFSLGANIFSYLCGLIISALI